MGTRSITIVYDDEKRPLVCLYRQFDGYPNGHGLELAEFLTPIRITNGMCGDTTNTANGMGCLAAQVVAHFKTKPGGFYLMPVTGRRGYGQEYEYHVYSDKVTIKRTWNPQAAIYRHLAGL